MTSTAALLVATLCHKHHLTQVALLVIPSLITISGARILTVFHLRHGQETCPVRIKLELFMRKQAWGPRWGCQWRGWKEPKFTSSLLTSIVSQRHQSGTIYMYLQILWRSHLTEKVESFFLSFFFFNDLARYRNSSWEEHLPSHYKMFVLVGPLARPAVKTKTRQLSVIIFLLYINFVQYSVWVYHTFR